MWERSITQKQQSAAVWTPWGSMFGKRCRLHMIPRCIFQTWAKLVFHVKAAFPCETWMGEGAVSTPIQIVRIFTTFWHAENDSHHWLQADLFLCFESTPKPPKSRFDKFLPCFATHKIKRMNDPKRLCCLSGLQFVQIKLRWCHSTLQKLHFGANIFLGVLFVCFHEILRTMSSTKVSGNNICCGERERERERERKRKRGRERERERLVVACCFLWACAYLVCCHEIASSSLGEHLKNLDNVRTHSDPQTVFK